MAFLTKDNSVKQKKQRVKYTKGAKTFLEERDEKYHNQMLAQAGASFWLSFLGIVVGFIVIIGSLFANGKWPGVVAGGIIETVSTLFFRFSDNASKRAVEFHNKILTEKNIDAALDLSEKIVDTNTKDELIAKLSLYLVGIDTEKICKNTKEVCKKINIEA